MKIENQRTPGPDELGDDTGIATTEQTNTTDSLGQVDESDKDIQVDNEGEKAAHNTGDTGDPEE
jgi:hypothetical protein